MVFLKSFVMGALYPPFRSKESMVWMWSQPKRKRIQNFRKMYLIFKKSGWIIRRWWIKRPYLAPLQPLAGRWRCVLILFHWKTLFVYHEHPPGVKHEHRNTKLNVYSEKTQENKTIVGKSEKLLGPTTKCKTKFGSWCPVTDTGISPDMSLKYMYS